MDSRGQRRATFSLHADMMSNRVADALRILKEAGRFDLLSEEAKGEGPRMRPTRKASGGVAAAVLACSPPRAKWRKVGSEHSREGADELRDAEIRQRAKGGRPGSPGGADSSVQSPGGTGDTNPGVDRMRQSQKGGDSEGSRQAGKIRGSKEYSTRKEKQQDYSRQQSTMALWMKGGWDRNTQ